MDVSHILTAQILLFLYDLFCHIIWATIDATNLNTVVLFEVFAWSSVTQVFNENGIQSVGTWFLMRPMSNPDHITSEEDNLSPFDLELLPCSRAEP